MSRSESDAVDFSADLCYDEIVTSEFGFRFNGLTDSVAGVFRPIMKRLDSIGALCYTSFKDDAFPLGSFSSCPYTPVCRSICGNGIIFYWTDTFSAPLSTVGRAKRALEGCICPPKPVCF